LFSGTAIIVYAHGVQLRVLIDAHVVTRWLLEFEDKDQFSLLSLVQEFLPMYTRLAPLIFVPKSLDAPIEDVHHDMYI